MQIALSSLATSAAGSAKLLHHHHFRVAANTSTILFGTDRQGDKLASDSPYQFHVIFLVLGNCH